MALEFTFDIRNGVVSLASWLKQGCLYDIGNKTLELIKPPISIILFLWSKLRFRLKLKIISFALFRYFNILFSNFFFVSKVINSKVIVGHVKSTIHSRQFVQNKNDWIANIEQIQWNWTVRPISKWISGQSLRSRIHGRTRSSPLVASFWVWARPIYGKLIQPKFTRTYSVFFSHSGHS